MALDDVPVHFEHDGREQVRRIVTHAREGFESFSFHVTHYDAGLEKDTDAGNVEAVLFVLTGSAVMSWSGQSIEIKPGMAFCIAPGTSWHHHTGPQGLTIAVCMSPPRE